MKRSKPLLAMLCLLLGLSPLSAQESVANLIKAKRYDAAEPLCRTALEGNPEDSKSLVNLGLCLEGQKRNRDAIAHWSSLIGKFIQGVPTDQQLRDRCLKLRSPETMSQAVAVGVEGTWTGILDTPQASNYPFVIEVHKTGIDSKGRVTVEGSTRLTSVLYGNHSGTTVGYVDETGKLILVETDRFEHRVWKNKKMVLGLTEQDKSLTGYFEASDLGGRIRLVRLADNPVPKYSVSVEKSSPTFTNGNYIIDGLGSKGVLTVNDGSASFSSSTNGHREQGTFTFDPVQKAGVCRWNSGAHYEFVIRQNGEMVGTWFMKDFNNWRCSMRAQ